MPLITLLCLCYAQHVSGTIMPIMLDGWMSVRTEGCNTARVKVFGPDTHPSILPALNLQPAATIEPDDLCGKQRYRRELLMMGIMVPEIC